MTKSDGIFDIREYGAKPDGRTLNTAAIQQAVDACHASGGGRVFCGPGEFLTGPLELKDHVELHLAPGCRIIGSPNPADYHPLISGGFRHASAPEGTADYLIGARHARNIAITGPGEINASGPAFYDQAAGLTPGGKFASGKPARRPRLAMFHKCADVRIEDASFVDSPCWTFLLMMCERVSIHRIKIIGDQRMINNDGIDIDACRDVTVSDCLIRTDDDCIVLRAMQGLHDEPAVCERVVVSNCVLESTCQGIRIGCPSDAVIRNCAFSNIVIASRFNGIVCNHPRRYLNPARGGTADIQNIMFDNFVIDCGRHPVKIDVDDGMALKCLSGFSFANFRIKSGGPILIKGSPETIVRDVAFSNVSVAATGGDAVLCRNCAGVRLDNVNLSGSMP